MQVFYPNKCTCFKKRQVSDSLTMEIIIAFGWQRRRLQKEAGGVEPCVLCADPIARTGEEVLYITAHRQLNTNSGRGGIRGFSWHSSSPVLYMWYSQYRGTYYIIIPRTLYFLNDQILSRKPHRQWNRAVVIETLFSYTEKNCVLLFFRITVSAKFAKL